MAKAARRLGAAIMAGLCVATTPGLAAEAVVVVGIDDAGCGGFPGELGAAKTEASRTYSMIGVSSFGPPRAQRRPPRRQVLSM